MTADQPVYVGDRRLFVQLMDGGAVEGGKVDCRPLLVAAFVEEGQLPMLISRRSISQSRAACSCTPFMAWMYGMGP